MKKLRLTWTSESGEQFSLELIGYEREFAMMKELHRGLLTMGRNDTVLSELGETVTPV